MTVSHTTVRASAFLLLVVALLACQEQAPPDPKRGMLTEATDSLATAAEVHASITGATAPHAESYSYRGLYSGIARERVDSLLAASGVPVDANACQPGSKVPAELVCSYATALGVDHAHVRLDVTYTAPNTHGERVAREITVTRELPLNVDGVQVAGALADAFERQTTLLDTRDASYGRHMAHIRMGTLNGARAHYADVTVTSHSGREELTVKMSRGPGK